ncbi:hypothetical protein Taro_007376, partial [Colocasia esculenta]|nr:hypothetical protein [Colocasia esculenta]
RAGAVFPQRPERSAPIFTPPQTQPLSSYPQSLHGPDYQREVEPSAGSDFPALRCCLGLHLKAILDAKGLMQLRYMDFAILDKHETGYWILPSLINMSLAFSWKFSHARAYCSVCNVS